MTLKISDFSQNVGNLPLIRPCMSTANYCQGLLSVRIQIFTIVLYIHRNLSRSGRDISMNHESLILLRVTVTDRWKL